MKVCGSLIIWAIFAMLIYIVNAERGTKPWSHIQPPAEGFIADRWFPLSVDAKEIPTFDHRLPRGPEIKKVPIQSPYSGAEKVSEPNLRERGLHLSEEIDGFLKDRERRMPKDVLRPNYFTDGHVQPDRTPPYMKETSAIFLDKFESRVADIHDEFSVRGLQESLLDSSLKDLPEMSGNTDAFITKIDQSIGKLSFLTPPDDLYKGISNERLYALSISEADTANEKVQTAFRKLGADSKNARATRFFFYSDFTRCCLNQIEYLRAELIKRIGPSAIDQEEMFSFNGPSGLTEIDSESSISTVLDYLPKFRQIAEKLKGK